MITTRFFRYPSGAYSAQTFEGGEDTVFPPVPEDAHEVSREVYEAGVAAVEKANEAEFAEVAAREQEEAHVAYTALLLVAVPEPIARRLSGYSGPAVADEL
ncbi:hypothetical protein ACH4RG_22930 [Streptomyces sp. NPDC021019]|uniref:hypothetical protein n=1 Tax=Streptomyces sp. NPDC021019 TaxID=3365108 RepID=UPI0037AA1741